MELGRKPHYFKNNMYWTLPSQIMLFSSLFLKFLIDYELLRKIAMLQYHLACRNPFIRRNVNLKCAIKTNNLFFINIIYLFFFNFSIRYSHSGII